MIKTKRAYDQPSLDDGKRYLIDRLWPRGMKKEELKIDGWLRELAPSDSLRKWFGHDPEKWGEFQKRYAAEVKSKPEFERLRSEAKSGKVTLVYGSKEQRYNNATALKQMLE